MDKFYEFVLDAYFWMIVIVGVSVFLALLFLSPSDEK
jgi:hypothetical protein